METYQTATSSSNGHAAGLLDDNAFFQTLYQPFRAAETTLKRFGLSPIDYLILTALAGADSPRSQSELARDLGKINNAVVSVATRQLEAAELVVWRPDRTRHREVLYQITESGRQIVVQATAALAEVRHDA